MDALIERILKAKSNTDWYVAAAFGLSFPIARYLLDKYVFEVSGLSWGTARWVCAAQRASSQRRCPGCGPAGGRR